ncbi:hypothetical protein CVT26_011956 [Gymnopilus dilepis]|uniref:MYND-type domain-containing protein n=1 Tax=Gymnopilus dilepis TaxID=231916 RepID=A0A409YHT9_9AGAR|nr:hypothetical protein CVT26_011956 [Gymnopilus dilepis]
MATMLVFKMPPFYKAKESPEEWDAEYEDLFKQIATFDFPRHYFDREVFQDRTIKQHLHQDKLLRYSSLVQSTCQLQDGLSRMIACVTLLCKDTLRTNDNFAARWMMASAAVRKKHALIGIAAACSVAHDLNEARILCSEELRVSRLSDDGRVLLNLFSSISRQDTSCNPTEPKYFPSTIWDRTRSSHANSSDEVEKLVLNYIIILRTKLISIALDNIVRSFFGLELSEIKLIKHASPQTGSPSSDAFQQALRNVVQTVHGKEEYKTFKAETKAAKKDLNSRRFSRCTECGKEAESRSAFQKCIACAKISREVLYCSRDCQEANWKTSHKLICGKPLDFDLAFQSAIIPTQSSKRPSDSFSSPKAAAGFNRPLALLEQMDLLQSTPSLDYYARRSVCTGNEDPSGIEFPEHIRTHFLEHRKKAMTTGDPRSAALICDCLLWHTECHKSTGLSRDKIIEQISGEYSIPVTNLQLALEEFDELRSLFPARPPAALILAHLDWNLAYVRGGSHDQ